MIGDTGIASYISLDADINKTQRDETEETKEGIVSKKMPELEVGMSDEDIVKLTDGWEKAWKESPKKTDWDKMTKESEEYWIGKQFVGPKLDGKRPVVDNVIFEALETYLPQATRRNPEPLIALESSEKKDDTNQAYVQKVKENLADLADKNKLRLKLKKSARYWSIFMIGIGKIGWDLDNDIPIVRVLRPARIILDPDATVDEDGYTGDRIGEYRKMAADRILGIIGTGSKTEKAIKKIKDLVKDDLGTKVQFKEWWTDEFMCWKLDDTILLKRKNPHWNYDSKKEIENVDDVGGTTTDEEEVIGTNHFKSPRKPYVFLSVFNLGDQPMDNTSLIVQNLANQDVVNKRNKQIDKNTDNMNNGLVVSLGRSGLTQPQAKGVSEALRNGGVVIIPDGAPKEAIDHFQASSLPADVFNDLADKRNRLRDIFGTSGSSASGASQEKTVRGKIINRSLDTDRIGGGISEYLEQFADDIYNWFVQMNYVYDSAFQFLEGGVPPKILVSVKEGSLLPKDSTSIANQAIELAGAGKMATVDLYKKLEYPNADELAANAWLEVNAPELLYGENPMVQQAIQLQQQAAQAEAEQELAKETAKTQTKNNPTEEKVPDVIDQVPIPRAV